MINGTYLNDMMAKQSLKLMLVELFQACKDDIPQKDHISIIDKILANAEFITEFQRIILMMCLEREKSSEHFEFCSRADAHASMVELELPSCMKVQFYRSKFFKELSAYGEMQAVLNTVKSFKKLFFDKGIKNPGVSEVLLVIDMFANPSTWFSAQHFSGAYGVERSNATKILSKLEEPTVGILAKASDKNNSLRKLFQLTESARSRFVVDFGGVRYDDSKINHVEHFTDRSLQILSDSIDQAEKLLGRKI